MEKFGLGLFQQITAHDVVNGEAMPTDPRQITIICYSRPEPQGSSRAFTPKGWNRPVITSANKGLKSFRQELSKAAIVAMKDAGLSELLFGKHEPVEVGLKFYFQRPPSVPKKRTQHVVKPDLDKLIRSTCDALTGIIYQDDSQIVKYLDPEKFYGVPERVELTVREYRG
jgi:crossover junction endodeoxyribonuclease RusA